MFDAAVEALDQCLDGLRLITGRLKIGDKGKSIHNAKLYSFGATGSIGESSLVAPWALAARRACVRHFLLGKIL